MRTGLAVVIATSGLALSACSFGDGAPAGSLPISPASTDARTPTHVSMPGARMTLHPARLLGVHVAGTLLSMPWELVNVRKGGRVLVVYYVSGDGVRPDGVNNIGFRLVEASDRVELIAVSRDDNHSSQEPGSLATGFAKITLSSPLGTRKLLHAPTSSNWPAKLLTS